MMRKLVLAFGLCAGMAQADTTVIAALGDSLTQGYGLRAEDGFVPQLQVWLQGQGADVRIINAGVSGDTTAGGLARVDWTLTDDVDAMIVALGGNDLLRGLDPAQARTNIDGILQAAKAKGVQVLLVGLNAPSNYGPDYQRDFDAIYPELSAQYGTLYLNNFFAGFGEARDIATVQGWMQADGIHPNPQGVKLIVEGMGPKVLELIEKVAAGS